MGGLTGVSRDSFGGAKGKTRVRDGSGMVWGATKDGKAAEDDEDDEKFGNGL